jgi:hypothetical protein
LSQIINRGLVNYMKRWFSHKISYFVTINKIKVRILGHRFGKFWNRSDYKNVIISKKILEPFIDFIRHYMTFGLIICTLVFINLIQIGF